jgi:hypothetical protein
MPNLVTKYRANEISRLYSFQLQLRRLDSLHLQVTNLEKKVFQSKLSELLTDFKIY